MTPLEEASEQQQVFNVYHDGPDLAHNAFPSQRFDRDRKNDFNHFCLSVRLLVKMSRALKNPLAIVKYAHLDGRGDCGINLSAGSKQCHQQLDSATSQKWGCRY